MADDAANEAVFAEIVSGLTESNESPDPKIAGYLQTHGMSHYDGLNEKKYIDLSQDVISVVGKNGSGKTTFLTEFALAARPWNEIYFRVPNEESMPELPDGYSPYWRGGFILDSPHDYMKNSKNFGPVGSLNLNDPKYEMREILHFLFVPPASAFSANFVRLNLEWDAAHHYKEFDRYLDEMRTKSKIGIFPVRVEGASRAQTSAENPLVSEWLLARVIFHNEDTPLANEFLKDIQERLKSLESKEEEYGYQDFLNDLTRYSPMEKEGTAPFGLAHFPILTNPLFTTWNLGGRLVWSGADNDDIRDELAEINKIPTEVSIERPKNISNFDNPFLLASIDSRLLNLNGKSDLEIIKLARPVKSPNYMSTFGKKAAQEYWEEFKPRTIEILEEWGVIFSVSDVLNWKLDIRIFDETENFSDFKGVYNDTARNWIHRAFQIAVLEKSNSPYRIAIWDEPEMGLHPSALDSIVEKVIPFMKKAKIKLVFSTHSMRLALAADAIKSCSRNEFGIPELSDWVGIDQSSAQELGFSKIDLLETIKKIIIVEGEMDYVVLSTVYQDELIAHRTKLLTLSGTENLLTIPNAGIIIDSLDSEILIVLDGRLRSKIKQDHLDALNAACKSGDVNNVKFTIKEIRKAIDEIKDEGKKLLAFLDLLVARADSGIVKRFSFFMFKGNDISNELPIKAVLGQKSEFTNWAQVDGAMRKAGIWITSKSQKEFLRSKGTPVDKKSCAAGARALLDKPLSGDFKLLRFVAFGIDD